MRWSVLSMFGATIELTGAFAIGGVIHQTVVQNSYSMTSPVAVFGIAGGIALIYVGRRLERRFEPSDYVPEAEEEEEDEEEYDEELSPVPSDRLEERLEGRESAEGSEERESAERVDEPEADESAGE